MKWDSGSRRLFLQGAGGFLLSIPTLASLLPKEARAEAAAKKRFVAITTDYGYSLHSSWYPTINRPTQLLTVPNHHPLYYQRLSDFAPTPTTSLSLIFRDSLNPYLDQVNFLRGLDFTARVGHAGGNALGNPHGDPPGHNVYLEALPHLRTIDQVINDSRSFNPTRRPIALLGFKRNGGSKTSHSFGFDNGGAVVPRPPMTDPLRAFTALFPRPLAVDAGVAPTDPNTDLISSVIDDYKRTSSSPLMGRADKLALDNMADMLSDLHKSLTEVRTVVAQCNSEGVRPGAGAPLRTEAQLLALMQAHVKVLVMAMVCDVVRVGTLSLGCSTEIDALQYALFGLSGDQNYHNTITHHHTDTIAGVKGFARVAQYQRWAVTGFVAPLLSELSKFTDPANQKTLLHNSLVHVSTEHSTNHSVNSIPCVLMGQAGGKLKTGYLVEYMNRTKAPFDEMLEGDYSADPAAPNFAGAWPGLFYNRLFATIFHALDIPASEYVHTVPAQAIGTVQGYGYVNANTYPANSPSRPNNAQHNAQKNAMYNLQLSGQPLPLPPTDAV